MKRIFSLLLGGALLVAGGSVAGAQPFSPGDTARISFAYGTGSNGTADADIANPQMSKNGRFVVFESTATNLVAMTQQQASVVLNGKKQIYLYDRQANSLELVSVTMDGQPSPVDCYEPSVSNDGRYVAFVADLRDGAVPGLTGKAIYASNFDQFVGPRPPSSDACEKGACNDDFTVALFFPGRHILTRDRLANETRLVSMAELETLRQKYEKGVPKFKDSGDPEFVSETIRVANTRYDVVNSIPVGTAGRQRGDSDSRRPYLSGDGRFVVYDTDGFTGAGYRNSTIEYDGEQYFNVWPLVPGSASFVIRGEDGVANTDDDYLLPGPRSGGFVLNEWLDFNGRRDIYLRDGGESPETRVVSFDCRYHQPRPLSCTILGNQDSVNGSVSDDGQFVAFESLSPFLSLDFNGVKDTYVVQRDKLTQDIVGLERISNNFSRIASANAASQNARISADGRYVVYDSAATNIVLGDSNSKSDVFLYDRGFFQTLRCLGSSGQEGNGDSFRPMVSGAGEVVAFHSNATNWGAPGGLFQAYAARVTKDPLGRIDTCRAELASVGAGTGGNGNSTQVAAAIVPRSATATPNPLVSPTPGGTPDRVRMRVVGVSYLSSATDVGLRAPSGTPAADTNGAIDLFQAPLCQEIDLATDTDGDGTSDCFDQCWKDFKKVEDADADGDGVADCEDNCKADPQKQQPGICGCGKADTDSDDDGVYDCEDNCPVDPAKTAPGKCGCFVSDVDSDGDAVPDCDDLCPSDVKKREPGACGCGFPDVDGDGKPLVGCATPVPTPTPTATPIPFEGRQAAKPTVKRLTAKRFEVRVSASGLPEAARQYRVSVELVGSSRPVSIVRSTDTRILVSGLRRGRYRVRYQVIGVSGKKTLFSGYSSHFQVR